MATMTLRVLHAGEMLDGAGDADGDVEVGRHDLAGLADLVVVGHVAGIDRGARGADGGAELVGDRLDACCEVLADLHAAAAGDDDLGRGQLRPVGLRQLLADEGREARIGRAPRPSRSAPSRPRRAAWKAAVRTVMTFLASVDCTVAMALPA